MRFLFTTFEGGGHVPPALLMASLLRRRGHEVVVMSDEANRAAALADGLAFRPWTTAPNRSAGGRADDPLDDWKRRWPPAVVRAVADSVMCGPAGAYARDTLAALDEVGPDLVVTNELLFGVLAACEARDQAVAILTGNLWPFPTRDDVPPFGPGWGPPRNRFERAREAAARPMIARWYDAGLDALNGCRVELGLPPAAHALDQLRPAAPIVLSASAAFDFDAARPPSPFIYAGPMFDLQPGAATPDPLLSRDRRNVLVTFSTTFQNQAALMARCIRALAPLDLNVIVTTGPAVRPEALPAAPNARIVTFAPHDELVPHCDLVICHGGHGTLMRPLMNGVPVLCLPMGRDQPENGRRLAHHGAGLLLSRMASAEGIRRAARRILSDPAFGAAARRLGRRVTDLAPAERAAAVAALEAAAQRRRMT